MEFDDRDEEEGEMGLPPVGSSYDNPLANSSRAGGIGAGGAGAAAKVDGRGESGAVTSGMAVGCPGNRKTYGGGGGGSYRECLKNHAVGIGGQAVDGCGEFLPAGEEGTIDALRCAACGCHRNFHRKELEGAGGGMEVAGYHPQFSPYYRTPAGYLHHHYPAAAFSQHHRTPPPPLTLPSTSGGGGHSRDEQEDMSMMGGSRGGGRLGASGSGLRKRFRTKFSLEQKDKMLAFAERVGWRIQKHDEAAVQQFCEETCVKRHVLKVWMHNNKHTLGKKP